MSKEKRGFWSRAQNYLKIRDCKFYSSFGWGGGIVGLDKNRKIIKLNTFLPGKINVVHIYGFGVLPILYRLSPELLHKRFESKLISGRTRFFHLYFNSLFASHANIHAT